MGAATAPLRAVLFDMDGTLLDSEKVWDVALDDLARHLGGPLSVAARQSMVGSSLWRSIAIVHDDLGVDARPGRERGLPDRSHRRAVSDPPDLEAGGAGPAGRRRGRRPAGGAGHLDLPRADRDRAGLHGPQLLRGHRLRRRGRAPEARARSVPAGGRAARRRGGRLRRDRGFAARDRLSRGGRLRGAGRAERGPIEAAPTRTVVASLVDVDVAFLRQLL